MKRILLFLSLICSLFSFTGCEIHFADGTRYDVPWWFALLVAVPFLIFGGILVFINCPKNFWAYCPKCKNRFYVNKRIFNLSSHSTEQFDFMTKCPCCGEKTLCSVSYDQNE